MRPGLPDAVQEEKIIPVVRGLNADNAQPLASALQDGGINTIEVTVEGEGGLAAISALAATRIAVGAGTVTSIVQAEAALGAGAGFLVSPNTDLELVEWSVSRGVPLIPGGFTPTEISRAWAQGVPAVKVFPASIGGPRLIKALLGPYPELLLIPTGGVNGSNVADYLAAGAVAVGVGEWLTGHDDLEIVSERSAELRRQVV